MIKYTVKVRSNGDKFWYLGDKLHREDGPAIEHVSGYKAWWLNGKLHREDGPAVGHVNGDKSWFLNGKEVTEQDVMKPVKEMSVAEIEAALGHKVKVVRDKITIGGMYYE